MSKTVREFACPVPRVQAARPASDLIRAFQKKPALDAVLIVTGTVPLGLITRGGLGAFLLSGQDQTTPLAELPKTSILECAAGTSIARAALELAKTDAATELIIRDADTTAKVNKDALFRALALENAARAKALKTLQSAPTAAKPEIEPNTSPLLRALTHEIRTPLSGMMGLAEVLTERLATSEERDLAQMILESGQTLDRTLRNANEIVRDASEPAETEPVTTDLETLVDDLRENWALLAARQKTRFSIDLSPDGPPRIKCQLAPIRESMDNLINNALRFTRSGDIAITLSTQPLGDQPLLTMSITQTGRRLSGAQKETINKALETGRLGGDVPGWALGLIVSQKTAHKLGGTLSHADAPLGGSMLTLSLPVERAEVARPVALATKPLKSGRFEPGTVLLVEDHEASALSTITALETAGWRVTHCHSLRDANALIDAAPMQAIVTDLNLLDGSGLTLIERVRNLECANQTIPIISMTAEIGAEKSNQALAAGASRALRKPVEGPELVATLADLIIQSERLAQPAPTRLRRRLVA